MAAVLPDHHLQPDLAALVEAAHGNAERALRGHEREPLEAVFWLATHLAAMRRVVHPALRRAARGQADSLHRARRADRALAHSVWLLDRRLTGEVRVAGLPIDLVVARTRRDLARHVAAERALLDALREATPAPRWADLAVQLAQVTAHAPTRAHPAQPDLPGTRAATFLVDSVADHLRDVLDNRHVPGERPARRRRPVGLWGRYLLGQGTEPTDRAG